MVDMMNYDHGGWWMGGMWFFPLLFWILVIAGVAFITKWFLERSKDNDESGRNEATALDILKKRYASGEIDRDTFEQMKKDIKEAGS